MMAADVEPIALSEAGLQVKDVDNLYVGDKIALAKGTPSISKVLKWRDRVWICSSGGGYGGFTNWELEWLVPAEDFAALFPLVEVRDQYSSAIGERQRDSGLGYSAGLLIKHKSKLYRVAPKSENVYLATDNWREAKKDHDEWAAAGYPVWDVWVGDLGAMSWSRPFHSREEQPAREKYQSYIKHGWSLDYTYKQKDGMPPVCLVDPTGGVVDAHFPPSCDRKFWVKAMDFFMGFADWTEQLQSKFHEALDRKDANREGGWPDPLKSAVEECGDQVFDVAHEETLNDLLIFKNTLAIALDALAKGIDPETSKPFNDTKASQARREKLEHDIEMAPQAIDAVLSAYDAWFGTEGVKIMCHKAQLPLPSWALAERPKVEPAAKRAQQLSLFDDVPVSERKDQRWLFGE